MHDRLTTAEFPAVSCRRMMESDIGEVKCLFAAVRPVVARSTNAVVYRAILRDALNDPRVTILLLWRGSEPIGYVVAIADWREYWRSFMTRHPFAAGVILLGRFPRVLARVDRKVNQGHHPPAAPARDATKVLSWADSSPLIAKVVHIGVKADHRGHGHARRLYAQLEESLRREGVARVDACIDTDNASSLKLHASAGWTISEMRGGFFATKALTGTL
ncbi:MAG: GNAT family N-acetyltransferase [Candidatus Zixiibacteriota bacterium]